MMKHYPTHYSECTCSAEDLEYDPCGHTEGCPCAEEDEDDDDDDEASAPDSVTIEEMPAALRDSHRAARNWGVYPHNGATRRSVSSDEADEIIAADEDGYAHTV